MNKILQFINKLPVLLLLLAIGIGSYDAYAQSTVVKGKVLSKEDNDGLPGVSIQVKGTTLGTITDADGNFSLDVKDPNATLVVSYIGFLTQEIKVSNQTNFKISLITDTKSLSEVIVRGYGEQARRELTGSISSVSSKDLENMPAVSADALLQGRAAGVVVTNNSGAPGGGVTVRIRGTGSINASNEPLYVVDGVPITSEQFGGQMTRGNQASISPIADINPNDIASMEILKDAAATAIYGARGANGVVLITTKRGTKGSSQLTFNTMTGITKAPPKLPMLNGPEAKTMFLEGKANEVPATWFAQWPNLLDNPTHPQYHLFRHNTDWQDYVRQDGIMQDYNLSFRGGDKKTTFSLSSGYTNQTGTIVGSGFERFSTAINADYKATDKFTIRSTLRLSRAKRNRIDEGNNFDTNPYFLSMIKMPFLSPWRIDPITGQTIEGAMEFKDFQDRDNPHLVAQRLENLHFTNRMIGNIDLSYDILPGLNFTSRFGLDFMGVKESRFAPDGLARVGRQAFEQWSQDVTWLNENILTYTKTFADKHRVAAMGMYSNQRSLFERITGSTDRMIDNTIKVLDAGPNMRSIGSNISEWGLTSFLGRVGYTYEDKYAIELTARADGSSRFGENNRWGYFPSVSGYWRISSMPFFYGVGFVNDLKLRGSYGQIGNQDISTTGALNTYGPVNYAGFAGVAQTNLASRSLSWESTNMASIALESSILDNKLAITLEYFDNTTNNLLVRRDLPNTSGFSNIWDNVGSIRNNGLELHMIGRIIQKRDLNWTVDFNISRTSNKILNLLDDQDLFANRDGFTGIARVGQSLGTFYGWVAEGVYANDSDNESGLRNHNGYIFKGGDVRFKDINGDGIIDLQDRVAIGSSVPDFFGGINNTVNYKNWDFTVFLQYEYGKDVMNATRQWLSNAGSSNNVMTSSLRRWRKQGDITDIPIARSREETFADNNRQSTRFIEDGSYLRVKNVMVGYNIPGSFFKNKISGARVYFSGMNLFTFSRYLGQDPEFAQPGNPILNGIDFFNYPQPRMYTGGINIKF
jgi:TonB-dependent starch-binding outer membrane protein SusC